MSLATQPLSKAEEETLQEVLTWVHDVVQGKGDSVAQMIVSTVLGCIPFVGQAVDVYNILRCIYLLTREIAETDHWIDLVLSLIAVVPGFGDALKTVFRGLLGGKKMGRVLDSLPDRIRGNVEKWFRTLDWDAYAREVTATINRILTQMIDVLENRITQWVMGKEGVKRLAQRLGEIKQRVSGMINKAMERMRSAHGESLKDPLPSTSAHVPSSPKAPHTTTPKTAETGSVGVSTSGTKTPAKGKANGQQRQTEKSKQSNAVTGASGEHIADYYYAKRMGSRRKVNRNGNLYEMTQSGHQGIDHVWHGTRLPFGYRISDTKGTNNPFHKLENAKAAFAALRYGIDAYLGEDDAARAGNAVGKTKGDGKQLSHRWCVKKLDTAQLRQSDEMKLRPAIRAWERAGFKLSASTTFDSKGQSTRTLVRCPYDRSLITVVGPNHNLHNRAKGGVVPRCSKAKIKHQVASEFLLPTELLRE